VAGYLVGGIRLLETVAMQKRWADDPARHCRRRAIGVPPNAVLVVAGCDYRYG
jgi:hypothetical protein